MSANLTQDRQRLQSAVWFTLRAVITLGLLGYVASRVDLTALAQRLREARPGCLILAFSVLLAQVFVAASRWNFVNVRLLYRIGYPSCLRYTFEGIFFGQMLPSSVGGDVLRVWRARQHGMPLAAATTGVFLDRLSALIAVLFAVLVGMPLLFKKVEIPGFAEAVGVLLGSTFLGLVSLVVLDRIALLPRHWHVTTLLHRLAADSRTLFIHPLTSFILLVYSSLVLVLTALSLYWIAIGLNVPLDLLDALLFTPLVVLITILPISIAGWGVREFGMATLLVHVGVSATEAVSLSLVQGLMLLAVSFPGAVLWTTTRGYIDRT